MRPSHHDASQSASAGPAGRREAVRRRPAARRAVLSTQAHACHCHGLFGLCRRRIYSLFLSTCRRRRALAYLAADS